MSGFFKIDQEAFGDIPCVTFARGFCGLLLSDIYILQFPYQNNTVYTW